MPKTSFRKNSDSPLIAEKRGKYRAIKPLTENQIVKATVTLMSKKIDRGDAITSPDTSLPTCIGGLENLNMRSLFACSWTTRTAS